MKVALMHANASLRRVLSRTCRYASMDVGVLLQQLENTPGVVVLITNKVCTPIFAPFRVRHLHLETWHCVAQNTCVLPLCMLENSVTWHLQPSSLDTAFQRRIRFELQFAMPPPALRAKLWRLMLPKQV